MIEQGMTPAEAEAAHEARIAAHRDRLAGAWYGRPQPRPVRPERRGLPTTLGQRVHETRKRHDATAAEIVAAALRASGLTELELRARRLHTQAPGRQWRDAAVAVMRARGVSLGAIARSLVLAPQTASYTVRTLAPDPGKVAAVEAALGGVARPLTLELEGAP